MTSLSQTWCEASLVYVSDDPAITTNLSAFTRYRNQVRDIDS